MWLQSKERELLRLQTDVARFIQQPRRESAGEAVLFDGRDLTQLPFDPATGINDWPMYNAPQQWRIHIDSLFPFSDYLPGSSHGGYIGYECGGTYDAVWQYFEGEHIAERVPYGPNDYPSGVVAPSGLGGTFVGHWRRTGFAPNCGSGYDTAVVELLIYQGLEIDGTEYTARVNFGWIHGGNVDELAYDNALGMMAFIDKGLPMCQDVSSPETDGGMSRTYRFCSRRTLQFRGSDSFRWFPVSGATSGSLVFAPTASATPIY